MSEREPMRLPPPMHPNAADAFAQQMENNGSYWFVRLAGSTISWRQWAEEEKERWNATQSPTAPPPRRDDGQDGETRMTPVVLIGLSREDGSILVVGLYKSAEAAESTVQGGKLPSAFYSIMTPPMNSCQTVRRAAPTPPPR